jgi:monomeric sarcosine oxidase
MSASSRKRIAVVGAGAVGSAAARFLAAAGHDVVILERFRAGHRSGSSHGESRVIRRAYPDGLYTALMNRAYPLWDDLEREAGQPLRERCGCLYFGDAADPEVQAVERALRETGATYERIDGDACNRRFPALRLGVGEVGIFDVEGGFLRAADCVRAMLDGALEAGAELHEEVRVTGIERAGEGLRVLTDGEAVGADGVLLAAGPWSREFAPELPLVVTRQQYAYFAPGRDAQSFEPARLPAWIDAQRLGGDSHMYGFPSDGRIAGVKVALHGGGATVSPDRVDRTLDGAYLANLRAYVGRRLPALRGDVTYFDTCLYTNTPDRDFIVDSPSHLPGVWMVGGLSGHGFKFSILLGRIAADLVTGRDPEVDLARFRAARFGKA